MVISEIQGRIDETPVAIEDRSEMSLNGCVCFPLDHSLDVLEAFCGPCSKAFIRSELLFRYLSSALVQDMPALQSRIGATAVQIDVSTAALAMSRLVRGS